MDRTAGLLLLTGEPIAPSVLMAAASSDVRRVDLTPAAWARVKAARAALLSAKAPTYGLTTGLGAHAYGGDAPDEAFGIGILSAHATTLAPTPTPLPLARACWMMWCNQQGAAIGGVPGVSPELVGAVLSWINGERSTAPLLDALESTDPGFGAIVVSSQLAIHVLKETQCIVRPGEALALMSHNNLLLARLATLCEAVGELLDVGAAVAALSLAGFGGNAALFEDERRWRSASAFERQGAAAVAWWTAGERWAPRRLQDPLDLRCYVGGHAALLAALSADAGLSEAVRAHTARPQSNPLVLPAVSGGGYAAGSETSTGFDTATLRGAIDGVVGGLGELCGRSYSRGLTLAAPELNGRLPTGLCSSTNGGVHNYNLPVIAAALAQGAAAAAASRPVGVRVHAADGVECTAAFAASAAKAAEGLVHSCRLLHGIEAATALAALRCRPPEEARLPPRLSALAAALQPHIEPLFGAPPFDLGTFSASVASAVCAHATPAGAGRPSASRPHSAQPASRL